MAEYNFHRTGTLPFSCPCNSMTASAMYSRPEQALKVYYLIAFSVELRHRS